MKYSKLTIAALLGIISFQDLQQKVQGVNLSNAEIDDQRYEFAQNSDDEEAVDNQQLQERAEQMERIRQETESQSDDEENAENQQYIEEAQQLQSQINMLKLKNEENEDDAQSDSMNILLDDQMLEENQMDDEDDDEDVLLEDDIPDIDDLMIDAELFEDYDHSNEFFQAGDQGMTPNGVEYIRNFPEQYDEDTPNKFMRSILVNYALEKKTEKGQPSGIFKMDKKNTMSASREVLTKYKKLAGKDLDDYMNSYFSRTWEHFDVNKDGMLDALDMTAFMKYLASDQSIDLDA